MNSTTEEVEPKEQNLSSNMPKIPINSSMTFEKAVDLGEYHPEYLAGFPVWHTLSRFMQFEFIVQALTNRRKQLLRQWMEVNRANDFRLKPHLMEASKNIEQQLEKLRIDKEKLYTEYSDFKTD
mgnify:CR=1 FL=1